jgi:leader peptidase (prepilin peptidase)/N-methyltransferase
MTLETLRLYLAVTAFVWGAIWGSFLNVVIYRLPAGLSVVHPPSRCPKCMTQLAWHDNVPIFGWLWLRGKCRTCKTPISWRYPAIELLTALLGLAVWWHVSHGRLESRDPTQWPLLAVGMSFCFFFYLMADLVTLAFIDLDETILPHELTAFGAVLGVAAVFAIPREAEMEGLWPYLTWVDALLGAVVGGGVIALIIKGYAWLRGVEGMGWGDFTLMGMCGLWTGWRGVIFILFAASVQGLLVTLAVVGWNKLRGREAHSGGFLIEDVHALDAQDQAAAQAQETGGLGDAVPQTKEPQEVLEGQVGGNLPPTPPVILEADAEPQAATGLGGMAVPFGPFIALATAEYILLGQWLLPWMLGGR